MCILKTFTSTFDCIDIIFTFISINKIIFLCILLVISLCKHEQIEIYIFVFPFILHKIYHPIYIVLNFIFLPNKFWSLSMLLYKICILFSGNIFISHFIGYYICQQSFTIYYFNSFTRTSSVHLLFYMCEMIFT